jgi:hypothetical protein
LPTIKHNIIPIDPIGLEEFSNDDVKVVESFDVNTTFDAFQHKIELHVYTEDNQLIDSYHDYRNEKFLQGSQTAGTTGASELTLDPKEDAERLGYTYGGINFVYNFLDNLYSETGKGGEFFIEQISEDRTEVRLLTNQIEEDAVVRYTNKVKEDLKSTSYFNEFRLNVKNNDLLIGLNIDIQDYREYKSVIVKLYEPLPQEYDLKQLLTIERIISDTVAFKVNTVITPDEIKVPYLKGPNFNIEEAEEQNSPTGFLNYNDLFSFPTNNTYREVHSRLNEKGVDISVHYNNFANFTQFSSIEERVRNFQYKLNLIETYQSQSDVIDNIEGPATGSRFLTGSSVYYTNKINTILDNFDHYDRHLYYESGSTSWPKQNNSKPYIQATGSATGSFFTEIILSASSFDQSNESQLLNSIPEYLREDPDSVNYNTFINMLAQHFDNIWVYAKALSDKYDNDNRLEYGISKDLVQDTLRNFGVKVYNNFRSTEDLFKTFTGQLYASESIHQTVVTASNNVISLENYRKDISKRIYHNLPYLLKTKGTERGLKALISSFGVPTNSNLSITNSDTINIPGLYVRTIGGNFTSGSLNFGPSFESTSSIAKIKIDNTGSIVASGSTLSYYTSVVQRDKKYSDDLHTVEVGFSPTYLLNEKIVSASGLTFNIDNYIGNPKDAYSSSYATLVSHSKALIAPVILTSSSFSVLGDGFNVGNVSHVNNLSSGNFQYRVQLSQSAQNSGSNPYSPNSDASDIPKANNSGYLIASGGGYVAVTNTPSWGLVQGSTSTYLNAVTNSNTLTLTQPASGQIYPGGILRQENDSSYSGSINGQVVTEVKLDGASDFVKHNVSFSDSNNNIIAFKVTGGPHTIPAGVQISISQTQWELETDSKIDETVYTKSGSHNRPNMFGYALNDTTTPAGLLSSPYKSHHYGEFVRSLKFYDNVLFKMIKDFVPARSNINTGIIIKPHLLERNKLKQVQLSQSFHYYSSSTETNDTTGSAGGSYTDLLGNELTSALTASYTESIVTPVGELNYTYHLKERARYDGELSGSYIQLVKTDGDLNDDNTWKYKSDTTVSYKGELVELITCPTVTTTTLNNTTLLTINATGSMNFGNNAARGFVFSSTTTTPTIDDTSSFHSSGSTSFSMSLNNLQTGSWYVRGYAQTEDCGIIYGDIQNLSITCPTVSTSTESSIGSGSFIANGNYSDLGTGAFISKGFIFWSGSATALEIGNGNIISRSIDTNSSTGAYSFLFADGPEHTVSDDSAYYYRAYASSSICTAYGNVEAVTTVDEVQTLATASFFVSTDTFANVAGLQASQVCGLGGSNYNPNISAAVSIKVYASASAMPGGIVDTLSTGDQIFYAEGANAGLPLNDVNSAARLFGLGNVNGHRPTFWALIEGVGGGANNGKIITDPGEYPGNPGIFSTGSICTV